MEENNEFIEKFTEETNPIGKKLFIIILFLLLLLIPLFCVENTIKERENFKNEAIGKVAMSWGHQQTIMAPELRLKNGETLKLHDYNIQSKIKTEYRNKGIFKIPVYTIDVDANGSFINPGNIKENATLVLNVSDIRGFIGKRTKSLNGNSSGIINLTNAPKIIPFKTQYTLRGICGISFKVGGINNNISVEGNWKNTSFEGDFFPSEKGINKNGYKATWNIAEVQDMNNSCDIMFLTPIDSYRMTVRCIKYGFLFIALTFLAFFLFEMASKIKQIHPFQYTLIGFSMIIFYMLLLSMSEFIHFGLAYFIATVMTISVIGGYTYFVLTDKDKIMARTISGILALLYIYLYTVLNLQDFALLIGSLGLFVAIIAIMYYTRDIKWYKD